MGNLKLLIANRGEIACRIIKTCKKMNIATVAVYSDADINSLFVQMADESYNIGPAPSSSSYLDIEKIINICKISGANLVHPGYGFLSENKNFVNRLKEENIIFVGPSSYSVEVMGDKIKSKKIAIQASVNTVPGHMGIIDDANEAIDIASKIGYPAMIKASAGGGGKGMRIVYNESEVKAAFLSAKNEAKNSFADDSIFIEKFIERPRHIEIQVIADKFNNIICLGERECSVQRNNQKVIEEAPSPFLDEETRNKMYEQTKSLVKHVAYYSAGTIEYIMDKDKNFYFLEMNTRLQVEHPVTELITGYDLVEMMINIALDKKLEITQEDVKLKGWAMESRIYAEDPSMGFLPSSGRIDSYIEPNKNKNIRIDTGIYEGSEISMFYDPMIAKLCSYGANREEAINNMKYALSEYFISGISHNMSFLETLMNNKKFNQGDLTTSFIKDEFPDGFTGNELTSFDSKVLISCSLFIFIKNYVRNSKISGRLYSREKQISDKWVVFIGQNNSYIVNILNNNKNYYEFECNNEIIKIESSWQNGQKLFIALVNDKKIAVRILSNNMTGSYFLQYAGSDNHINVYSPRIAELTKFIPKFDPNKIPDFLESPIAGKIINISVKEGDIVNKGQELLTIEAMKMENSIKSGHHVKIKSIICKKLSDTKSGDRLIEFEEI